MKTIQIVAGQEIRALLRSKGIMITVVTMLVVVIAAIFGTSWYQKNQDQLPELVVVGVDSAPFAAGNNLTVTTAPDRAAAEQQVRDGKDAALVATDQGFDLLADGAPSESLVTTVTAAVQRMAQERALAQLHITEQQYSQATPPSAITTVNVGRDIDAANVFTTYLGVFIMMTFIMTFAAIVGSRVTEEKSSRVIEIILSSVRPLNFLAGKLLGSLIMGALSTAIIITVGAIAVQSTGLLKGTTISYGMIPLLIVGYILGMLFFGSLYAAAGSMVSRTEDLQSTQSPILILMMATMYAAVFGSLNVSSPIVQVLAWIPPFSTTLTPISYAANSMSLVQLVASYVLLAAATGAALWLSARIYRGSILHNGRKGWMSALR